MRAIYRGVPTYIADDYGEGVVLDTGTYVSFGDPDLIVDPTDDQLAAAEAGDPIPPDPNQPYEVAEVLASFGIPVMVIGGVPMPKPADGRYAGGALSGADEAGH